MRHGDRAQEPHTESKKNKKRDLSKGIPKKKVTEYDEEQKRKV